MEKETILTEIGEMLADVVKHMATKTMSPLFELMGDVVRVGEQVRQSKRSCARMQHVKLQSRVADLAEQVFGKMLHCVAASLNEALAYLLKLITADPLSLIKRTVWLDPRTTTCITPEIEYSLL